MLYPTTEDAEDLELLVTIHGALGRAIEVLADRGSLVRDRDDWKKKYVELLNNSVRHSHEAAENMLFLAMGSAIREAKEGGLGE